MATLFEFSQAISKLNKEGKFNDALKYFKENKEEFSPELIGNNKYIVSEIISALIETNHHDAIFDFLRQYNNVVLDPKSFPYLLKKLKKKLSVNWNIVNRFCDLISSDQLDTECKTIEVERKGIKKPMELASAKEDWFAVKTKALFEMKRYHDCFDLSKKALELFDKFHYSNEVWFARRIALSKKYLGNSDDALNELFQILKRKKEWFIQVEVAEILKEKGEIEKAFEYAIDAINNFGDIEYKVGLLEMLGDLLLKKENQELAFKHYSLAKLLRTQEQWKIPDSLSTALNSFSFEELSIDKKPILLSELLQYWNKFKPVKNNKLESNKFLIGKIDKILNDNEKGIDGFIKYDSNKSIYFSINALYKADELTVGTKVKFKILPAIEDKKERATKVTKEPNQL